MIRTMNTGDEFTGPVNLGNPGEFTIRELANLVVHQTGASSAIQYLPLPQDDPRQRRPDITLARAMLDWEPRVELATGLARTIDYFKKLMDASGLARAM